MPIETHGNGGATITGNAINWFAARVLLSGLGLYLKTGMQPNRSYTPARMRDAVSGYTGKRYARSRKGLEAAHADLATFLTDRDPDSVTRPAPGAPTVGGV